MLNYSILSVFLYYIVKIGLYIFAVSLLVYFFGNDIVSIFNSIHKKSVFRGSDKKYSRLYMHIEKIYFALYGMNNNKRVYNFYIISAVFFLVPLYLLRKTLNPLLNISIATFSFITPYIYLRLNLYKVRVESSFDADKVITEISNQYKICNFNMREAIRRAERFLVSAPYTRKQIYSLALALDTYKTDDDLKMYLNYFVYSINTQWAKMLSNNIYFAVSKDFNVSEGLSDILKDIKNSYEAAERANRENTESFLMIFFLAPILLFTSPFLANKILGIKLSKYLHYQFNTPIGIALFIIISLSMIINYFIMYFLKRKKFDI